MALAHGVRWLDASALQDQTRALVIPFGLVASLALFASLALRDLWLPGLYYDELIQVVPALGFVSGGLSSSVNGVPASEIRLFGRSLPLMAMDYIGAVKTIAFIPIVAVAGVSPESVRATTATIGAASLLTTFAFARWLFGPSVALLAVAFLATDPSFTYYVRVDYGPTALMMLLKGLALWQLAVWWRQARLTNLAVGALALGLGVYDKANFLWIVAAIGAATILVAPGQAIARASSPRAWAIAGGAMALGAAPLIWYNAGWPMPTLAALSGRATAGGPSGGFAEQLLQRLGVLEHLLDGRHLAGGVSALTPTDGLLALLAAGSAVLIVLGAAVGRPDRAALFVLLAGVLVLVAAAATRGGFAGHHVILVYPFPHLLAAIGVASLARWARSRGPAALLPVVAVAAVAVGQGWTSADSHLRSLRETGGAGNFSEAIYGAAAALEMEGADRPVVALDWGLHLPLVGLSQGRLRSVEVTDGSPTRLRDLFADPRTRYVAHAPEATNLADGWRGFVRAAESAGLEPVRQRRLGGRAGPPVIDLYVLIPRGGGPSAGARSDRPGASGAWSGREPVAADLLNEQGRGRVAAASADDQVRLVAERSEPREVLLTIADAGTTYSVPIPEHARLRFALAQPENVWAVTTGAVATVTVVDGAGRTELLRRHLSARDVEADRAWTELSVDLAAFAGRAVELELAAATPPAGNHASWVIWRRPVLLRDATGGGA